MRTILTNVYAETDYSVFKKLVHNRITTEKHILEVQESMADREILNPIIVNEKMEIIEGQHRYEALKRLGRPIKFVVDEGANIEDCRRLNEKNKNWDDIAYAKSFAEEGNENYKKLLDTAKETGLSISTVLDLVGCHANNRTALFRSGDLRFSEKEKKEILLIKKMADEIADALRFDKTTRLLLRVVKIITSFAGYDHKRMVDKCKQYRFDFIAASKMEDQLKCFSEIYNKNAKKNNRIYFEDYMRNKGSNVRDYGFANRSEEADASTLEAHLNED